MKKNTFTTSPVMEAGPYAYRIVFMLFLLQSPCRTHPATKRPGCPFFL